MLRKLFATEDSAATSLLRLVVGIVFFAHGTIGVIAVEVGSTDTGGSGKGREGGGEIGGNDNGGGVYEKKKVIDNCTLIKIYIF